MGRKVFWIAVPLAAIAAALGYFLSPPQRPQPKQSQATLEEKKQKPLNPIVQAAREQLINPASYSGKYYKIDYPMGDVPPNRGACTDVIIRALRKVDIDLQEEVQKDADTHLYPRMLVRDTNIDHRRCPNLITYFSRHAEQFPIDSAQTVKKNIQPGDIIFWKLHDGKDHVGIASNVKTKDGYPFIIHNIGPTVAEQDVLFSWKVVGHFRVKSPQ